MPSPQVKILQLAGLVSAARPFAGEFVCHVLNDVCRDQLHVAIWSLEARHRPQIICLYYNPSFLDFVSRSYLIRVQY
jgi:hypothetical protein